MAELPTITLPWTGPGIRVRVENEDDANGDIAVELVDDIGTLWLNADDATEAAAALLEAADVSREITGERPTVTLRAAALGADERRAVAEEIARALEAKAGHRCPECGGKAGSVKRAPGAAWGSAPTSRCGAGHTWSGPTRHITVDDAAAIARQLGGA